ncbi:MAG: NADH-quinone oxidoreductase subunit F [Candidatus Binatia bacterium]|nr:MAG: NADH-quinone oxidoreductase subunit F [Candidatus Binatia bacterium]
MGEKVLLRHEEVPGIDRLEVYVADGGYTAARTALREKTPAEIVEMVRVSGLRGRGGAGFPTGVKWGFLPKDSPKPRYLCVNADESEPGTFKDRQIIEFNPHLLLEGTLISAYAIQAHVAYVYIRGEFARGAAILERALREAYAAGHFGRNIYGTGYDLEVYIHRGAGAYICGEETGLIESLEGKRAYPRVKPPFPATVGVFGCPTIVNNVETLACVPLIVGRGPEWFRAIGPEKCPGPKLYCLSGHVQRPGVYEAPMGISLRELVYGEAFGGGIPGGKKLKGVIPGGSSVPVLLPEEIDVPMDFDSVAQAGSLLGSCGIIVMDEDTCMVDALRVIARFYHHESCGQCTPCREGTGWLERVLEHLEFGGARPDEVDLLLRIADNMMGNTICLLADAAAMPTRSFVTKFRSEFEEHVRLDGCPKRLAHAEG